MPETKQPILDRNEHDNDLNGKRVANYIWNPTTLAWTRDTGVSGLEIPPYDYISLTYTGDNITGVVYKTGGSGGTTVATLTLAYSGSNLTSVTKS